ncbi:MAG: T9SS type A sorting domain-containing protein [Bacteroidetes bacterium]|nr:T9SS type A sorting domain-containing protein [Bacteroidota bacterium]
MKKTNFIIAVAFYAATSFPPNGGTKGGFGTSCSAQNTWSPVGAGTDNVVKTFYRDQTANMLYVGGAFQNAGGAAANFIAKCDGENWSALGTGTNSDVNAITMKGTKLYAGGSFTTAGGSSANYIAVWDTAASTWSTLGTGMDGDVNALAIYSNELYAGGMFSTADGNPTPFVAKWNGSTWVDVGGGMSGSVLALAVYNGELYAGGTFMNAGGKQTNNIARWNGAVWDTVDVGMDFDVYSLYVFGGELYVGGAFNNAGSVSANHAAKWNATTGTWSALGAGTDLEVTSFTDRVGTLYAGGRFFNAGGNPASYIAKWNGTQWDSLPSTVDDQINALQKHKGAVYAGGNFTNASGQPASFIAKWCDVDAQISASDTILCVGQSATLTATDGNTYSWFSGETDAAISVSPSVTTTYTVIAYRFVCSDTTTFTITVPQPVAGITGNDTICFGASTVLTASGGVSYLWNTSATTTSISLTLTSTSTFTVIATDANGCTDDDSIQVVVNPLPSASAGSDVSICLGETTTLTASGGGNYLWNSGQTDAVISVTPTSTTGYIVTVTDVNVCSNSDTVTVFVNPLPAISISASITIICSGDSSLLTASGGNTYLWDFGSTDAMVYVSPTTTTSYTVTGTDGNGCSNTDAIAINVSTSITAMITATDTTICDGENPTLTASGGTSFAWNTGETTASISVMPSTSTTYSVIVNSSACSDTALFNLSVNPTPTVTVVGGLTICEGDTSVLTAQNSATGVSYSWSTNETTASITVAPASTTNYSVTITDANGCSGSANGMVTVNSLPTASISGNTPICAGGCSSLTASGGTNYLWSTGATDAVIYDCINTTFTVTVTDANGCSDVDSVTIAVNPLPTASISGNTTVCAGDCSTLTALGGTDYLWNTGQTTSSITVCPTTTTGYTVTVMNASGCTDVASVTVTVNPSPVLFISGGGMICSGQNAVLCASGCSSYQWNTGATSSCITISPTSNTTYSVVCMDASSCSASASVAVTVTPVPSLSVTATDASCSTCCDGTATANATGNFPFMFSWNPGSQTTSTATGLCVGNYTVCVTDANGCTACDTITVSYTIGIAHVSSSIGISIFPNPFNLQTTIVLSSILESGEVIVTDMVGKKVISMQINNSNKFIINRSTLSAGVYFMKVISESKPIAAGKLIIQ